MLSSNHADHREAVVSLVEFRLLKSMSFCSLDSRACSIMKWAVSSPSSVRDSISLPCPDARLGIQCARGIADRARRVDLDLDFM